MKTLMKNNIEFRGNIIEITNELKIGDIEVLLQAPHYAEWLQFIYYEPSVRDLQILNNFFNTRPEIYLRFVGNDYLKHIPNLQKVWFHNFKEKMFKDLSYLNNVTAINLGRLSRKIDISPIEDFKSTLLELKFENDIAKKSINTISKLEDLKSVLFISSKFDSFDFLTNLKLNHFGLYGSRTKNYSTLKEL